MTAFAQFLEGHPAYSATGALDELRASEYGRLDAQDQVYLDYTGGGLYAESQVREHMRAAGRARLRQPALGEPELDRDDAARRADAAAVLAYFNAHRRVHRHLHAERVRVR